MRDRHRLAAPGAAHRLPAASSVRPHLCRGQLQAVAHRQLLRPGRHHDRAGVSPVLRHGELREHLPAAPDRRHGHRHAVDRGHRRGRVVVGRSPGEQPAGAAVRQRRRPLRRAVQRLHAQDQADARRAAREPAAPGRRLRAPADPESAVRFGVRRAAAGPRLLVSRELRSRPREPHGRAVPGRERRTEPDADRQRPGAADRRRRVRLHAGPTAAVESHRWESPLRRDTAVRHPDGPLHHHHRRSTQPSLRRPALVQPGHWRESAATPEHAQRVEAGLVHGPHQLRVREPLPAHADRPVRRLEPPGGRAQVVVLPFGGPGLAAGRGAVHARLRVHLRAEAARQRRHHRQHLHQPVPDVGRPRPHPLQLRRRQRRGLPPGCHPQPRPRVGANGQTRRRRGLRPVPRSHQRHARLLSRAHQRPAAAALAAGLDRLHPGAPEHRQDGEPGLGSQHHHGQPPGRRGRPPLDHRSELHPQPQLHPRAGERRGG